MSERFRRIRGGRVVVTLAADERRFLADITLMLNSVMPSDADDPASTRLHLPVYLDDPESAGEWRRLMGDQLESSRSHDRSVFDRVMGEVEEEVVLEGDEAEALLRVINEGRLVLASRLGVQVASDFDDVDAGSQLVLDFMHWLLEDLTTELSRNF